MMGTVQVMECAMLGAAGGGVAGMAAGAAVECVVAGVPSSVTGRGLCGCTVAGACGGAAAAGIVCNRNKAMDLFDERKSKAQGRRFGHYD